MSTPALTAESEPIMVPVRLLRTEWPPNAGVMPGDERFDALLASIRAEGIREPLTISLGWRVIDGCHRLAAARLLGMERVPVRFWTETEFVPSVELHVRDTWLRSPDDPACRHCGPPWPCKAALASPATEEYPDEGDPGPFAEGIVTATEEAPR